MQSFATLRQTSSRVITSFSEFVVLVHVVVLVGVGHKVLGSSAARCFLGPRVERSVYGTWFILRLARCVLILAHAVLAHAEVFFFFESVAV